MIVPGKAQYKETEISPEQFIAEHVFLFVIKGAISCYDGDKSYSFKPGECFLARKNRLARYDKEKFTDAFEKVLIRFDEKFLKGFHEKHKPRPSKQNSADTFLTIGTNELIRNFIHSLTPYYNASRKLDDTFADLKHEELLIILLKNQPDLAGVFFDFRIPQKIDLEEFMNRNYKFNVSLRRFAYLTGRSLSAFKRDFKRLFNQTPNRWLVKKRLQEAYFLIDKKHKKASEIYVDLGFENLSHFSFAFKKLFNVTPTQLGEENNS